MRDSGDLFMRLCGFFARLGFTIADAKIHTTATATPRQLRAARPRPEIHYRDLINLLEHDLAERLKSDAPADRPAGGRLSREVKHFPITPTVNIRPDERGQHYIMSVTAADRPGCCSASPRRWCYGINLHTAKIAPSANASKIPS